MITFSRLTMMSLLVSSLMIGILQCDMKFNSPRYGYQPANNMDASTMDAVGARGESAFKRRLLAANNIMGIDIIMAQPTSTEFNIWWRGQHEGDSYQTAPILEFGERVGYVGFRLDDVKVPNSRENLGGLALIAYVDKNKNNNIQRLLHDGIQAWKSMHHMQPNDPVTFTLWISNNAAFVANSPFLKAAPWDQTTPGLKSLINYLRTILLQQFGDNVRIPRFYLPNVIRFEGDPSADEPFIVLQ